MVDLISIVFHIISKLDSSHKLCYLKYKNITFWYCSCGHNKPRKVSERIDR